MSRMNVGLRFRATHQRPLRRQTVAAKILALPFLNMRRSRRVSSCTLACPIPGRMTERGRSGVPTRMAGNRPFEFLLRNRNDPSTPVFFLNLGNPTRGPRRLPERESDQAPKARPQSTAASSKTC